VKDIVLVVDDSPETLGMLNVSLNEANMTVLVALDGNQALSIAQSIKPDIILLDAVMPGPNGFEVCKMFKQDSVLHSIPVIFMTGLSDTENVLKGLAAGGVDYVTKPINTVELLARMAVHLKNARHTNDAHTILDDSGHFVFSVDADGRIVWSTDHVNQLIEFDRHGLIWQQSEFEPNLKSWLKHKPNINDTLSISTPTRNLRITLFRITGNQEYLLRVLDTDTANEIKTLRKRLNLTNRESEVLLWISKAKSNPEIANILGTSPRTINKHSENLYKKLNVENRTAAATIAMQIFEHN
jgi:DNA-binding response OmpR family regulator/DNA-binding CsgD family transcriptional regulator